MRKSGEIHWRKGSMNSLPLKMSGSTLKNVFSSILDPISVNLYFNGGWKEYCCTQFQKSCYTVLKYQKAKPIKKRYFSAFPAYICVHFANTCSRIISIYGIQRMVTHGYLACITNFFVPRVLSMRGMFEISPI
jgi:hypothetical protein